MGISRIGFGAIPSDNSYAAKQALAQGNGQDSGDVFDMDALLNKSGTKSRGTVLDEWQPDGNPKPFQIYVSSIGKSPIANAPYQEEWMRPTENFPL